MARSAQFWGAVVAVSAALAVITAYLVGGPRAVWTVAAVETLLVMVWVARRFRAKAHPRPVGEGPGAAHCERCRRAQERLEMRAASAGRAVRDQ
ncbi:hypothetical protein [Kitasatospora sp. NPDC051914]|uniref:hypothetical protein n=1 Tax=Kitasatospora sp. NPDC051914 TaxID=3154945 RepID=UPI0034120491